MRLDKALLNLNVPTLGNFTTQYNLEDRVKVIQESLDKALNNQTPREKVDEYFKEAYQGLFRLLAHIASAKFINPIKTNYQAKDLKVFVALLEIGLKCF